MPLTLSLSRRVRVTCPTSVVPSPDLPSMRIASFHEPSNGRDSCVCSGHITRERAERFSLPHLDFPWSDALVLANFKASQRFDIQRYDAMWRQRRWALMSELSKRSTIYFEPELHRALRVKAASTHRSVSEIVNDALRLALREDQEDLAVFDERAAEPILTYEELLNDLKAHGKL